MNWAKLGPKLYSSFTSLNNGGQNERERLCKTYLETVCIAQQNAETLNPQIKLLHSMSSMATSLLKTPLNVFHKTPQSLCMLLEWRKLDMAKNLGASLPVMRPSLSEKRSARWNFNAWDPVVFKMLCFNVVYLLREQKTWALNDNEDLH